MREYYDRNLPAEKLHPASSPQQDAYRIYRSRLTEALQRNWQAILDSSQEIREAADNLDTYIQGHPTREFRIFRPEDVGLTTSAGDPLFLR